MYLKNLTKDLRLRLSEEDMNFLADLAEKRGCSVSQLLRYIIADYRRSIDIFDVLREAVQLANVRKDGSCPDGDTKTDINDKL